MTTNKYLQKVLEQPWLLVIVTVIIKIPLFFTGHLQEDSFITWRVSRNLLEYGVIGFNGEERISASTTHLYVFLSAFFQLIFQEHFMYPLLIFNGLLFAMGSYFLAKIFFARDLLKRGIFVILMNMVPPALTASCLGMEYGLLFSLYNALLYFGLYHQKNWAYVVFPLLLLWTRIDTVIFLGIFFLADRLIRKKINWLFVCGGLIGVISVVGFNYLYFGELVNHTITAKKIAYKNLLQNDSIEFLLYQWAYYGGLIKKYGWFSFIIFILFLGFLAFALSKIVKTRISDKTKIIIIATAVFALVKITVFAYLKAYFDWYYWLPRVFLFGVVLYYLLQLEISKNKLYTPLLFILAFGFYAFQILQSYAIGYMETEQRMQMVKDLEKDKTGISKSILLEPAGKIPFFTGLYTYDEVGLVNKKINDQMLKDEKYWWINSIKTYHPDYVLTIIRKPGEGGYYQMKPEDLRYFEENYKFVKEFPISDIHHKSPEILQKIYSIRPIGQNYFLYKAIK